MNNKRFLYLIELVQGLIYYILSLPRPNGSAAYGYDDDCRCEASTIHRIDRIINLIHTNT